MSDEHNEHEEDLIIELQIVLLYPIICEISSLLRPYLLTLFDTYKQGGSIR